MRTKSACIAVLVLFLSACGNSGGGGGNAGQDASCGEPDCGRETDDPDAEAPPAATPTVPPVDQPEAPLACGAGVATTCPQGYHCVDDATGCDPATGVACTGTCVLGEELPRCGGLTQEPCPEGSICADDPRDNCEGGPVADCGGVCRPRADGQCATDADCPQLDAPCTVCADGSLSCPSFRCDSGQCTVDFKPCSEAQVCGGLSGLACEPGFKCTDDPTDRCDPNTEGADCRGICVPDVQPPQCGGVAGITCPPGFECVDAPNDMCDPADGGADCPALCQPASGGECTSDADCPALRAPCSVCPDGSESCPRSFCEAGRCGVAYPTCAPPPGCTTDAECAPGQVCVNAANEMCDPDDPATRCVGVCVADNQPRACGGIAGETCPEGYTCVDKGGDDCTPDTGADCPGICEPAPPKECATDGECGGPFACATCSDGVRYCVAGGLCRGGQCFPADLPCPDRQCTNDASCGSIIQSCEMCPDGSASCAYLECRNGVCVAGYSGCRAPEFCGGIAGFPCQPGFTCIDAPGDECDPERGGADCGGVCVRQEEPPKCGGINGGTCPDGQQCVDSPADDCDPANGGADCPAFCRPVPGGMCASDADCPQIGAPCRICADGTAACPRSFCEAGQCRADFGGCGGDQ